VSRQDLADEIVIRVFESASKKEPTVEVRDYGVGIVPAALPLTILSLNAENKITKPYLAGAYGQGGFYGSGLFSFWVRDREPPTEGSPRWAR